MKPFKLVSPFKPAGGQPQAIAELVKGVNDGRKDQVLLGVTGVGKTFTIASVIEQTQRPTLVLAHNKTLAAQLYQEFKELFPENAVEYFVSYYDFYQPEAYVPSTDTYIEKDAAINDEIDRMRHSATRSVLERKDVIVVASVSCIYGIGSPQYYLSMMLELTRGMTSDRDKLMHKLVELQYQRNDMDFHRGTFRVRGDYVDVFPAGEKDRVVRLGYFGDELEEISELDPLTGEQKSSLERVLIFPNSHYVTPPEEMKRATESIRAELKEHLAMLFADNRVLHGQRLEQRTTFDLEMMELFGHCKGIENYSRHLDGRAPGSPPSTLIHYFPKDFLCILDESHVMVPQIHAMYKGDRSRKETLVEYGFRLPSAMDNRPLCFEEWEAMIGQTIFVSATPGDWELDRAGDWTELIIRPTGLVDPEVELRPVANQVDDVIGEIRERIEMGDRVLVGTLTRRMAEDLTQYLGEIGIRARYMHADVDTLDRIDLLEGLREGRFDVLVGINLLREGLDLPEVSLVAVLDADREGFLRGTRSLIQVSGRAARNINGKVILYADKITGSISQALTEMDRRREIQLEYNRVHGITPMSISKPLKVFEREGRGQDSSPRRGEAAASGGQASIEDLRFKMMMAAEKLDFEQAALYRDEIRALELNLTPSKGRRSRRR